MKYLIKNIHLALVGFLVMAFNACTDDYEYVPASASGNEVYFSNTLASTIELVPTEASFEVPINRIDDSENITVSLTLTSSKGAASIYSIPANVSFLAGEKEAMIKVSYNPMDIVYGEYENLTIAIADEKYAPIYGQASYSFQAGVTAWADYGTGYYREDCMTTFFGVDNLVYEVKIEKNTVEEGMYRLVNPYGAAYGYNEEGDYDASTDYYLTINATNPEAVYVEQSFTGMNWNDYGEVGIWSLASYYMSKGESLEELQASHPEYFGKLEEGIITMPTNSLLISMANYNDGGWYSANVNGMFAVALPGSVIADYSVSAAYMGRFTNPDDEDYAQVALTFGDDVASVKYALVSQNVDVDATVEGIINGSIDADEATAEGTVQLAYEETGNYNFVMVVYNADGEAVGNEAIQLKLRSSKDAAEQFSEIATGIFTIGAKDQSLILSISGEPWGLLFEESFSQNAVLSQSQSDPTHFMLTPYLEEEYPLYFTMTEDGTLIVDEVESGLETSDGMILASDIVTLYGADSDNAQFLIANGCGSTYDKEQDIFNFNIAYTVGSGFYAFELETFKVDTWGGTAAVASAMRRAMSVFGNHKKMSSSKHHIRQFIGSSLRKPF